MLKYSCDFGEAMAVGREKRISSRNECRPLVRFTIQRGVVIDGDAEGTARVGLVGSAIDPVVQDGAHHARVAADLGKPRDPSQAEDVRRVVIG